MTPGGPKFTPIAIVGGLTAFGFMALMAVIFVAHGDDAAQRLGLFFGVCGVVITGLVSMLRADQSAQSSAASATQTNGSLDARIHDAVTLALASRRVSDTIDNRQPPPPPKV